MKTISIAVLAYVLLIASVITHAQVLEIDCGDDIIIQDGIDVQFTTVSPGDTHIVSALGIGDYDPVLAVFNQQQFGSCNNDSLEAAGIDLEFPTTGYVSLSDFNSQLEFSNNSFMRVMVGDIDDFDGEAVLMVEGLTMDGQPDTVNVIVTERMIQSQISLTVYAIPVTEDLDLKLALVDDNGVPLLDARRESVECDDAGDNELCWGAHTSLIESFTNVSNTRITEGTAISPMLSIPLTPDDAGTIVPIQISQSPLDDAGVTGEYVFVLHYGIGDVGVGDAAANVTPSSTGVSLFCDDTLLVSDAIDVTIPRLDDPAMIRLLAQGATNPVMATMIDDSIGICYITSGTTAEQSGELPLAGMFFPSDSNTDADILGESVRLLTGLAGDVVGSYLVAIEGLNIPPDGTPDIVSITITESMVASGEPVIAYMIALGTDLDPQLSLVSAEQETLLDGTGAQIVCSHTTLPGMCWGEFADINNASLTLNFDTMIRGISSDVMLTVPLSDEMIGTPLNFMASRVDETFGDYILLFYLSSGTPEDSDE